MGVQVSWLRGCHVLWLRRLGPARRHMAAPCHNALCPGDIHQASIKLLVAHDRGLLDSGVRGSQDSVRGEAVGRQVSPLPKAIAPAVRGGGPLRAASCANFPAAARAATTGSLIYCTCRIAFMRDSRLTGQVTPSSLPARLHVSLRCLLPDTVQFLANTIVHRDAFWCYGGCTARREANQRDALQARNTKRTE